jgi:glycosyltransferase involved in cell wall biosynthesis
VNVSVIVCTHNPRADYFARCLEGLRAQTLALDRWELLLVDNLSDRPVETTVDISWHPNARVIGESTLGLTPARLRGIRESHGDLLVFVDDDNVLTQDYLDQTERIANEHPFIGSWSGQCLPEFDVPPPEWTRRYWGALCIREFEKNVWSSLPLLGDTMPCGAGLCVRRRVALHYVGLYDRGVRSIVLDRVGTSLASGGDNDLAACACDLSLGVGLFSGLKLTHLIPPQRLTEDYLCRLVEAIEFSGAVLNAERGVSPPVRSLIGKAADQLRVWRQQGPHRKILRATFRGRDAAAHWIANKSVEQAPGFLSSILPTPRQTQN